MLLALSANVATDAIGQMIPEVMLVIVACLLLLGGAFGTPHRIAAPVATFVLIYGVWQWWFGPKTSDLVLETSFLRVDALSWMTRGMAFLGGLGLTLLSWHRVSDRYGGEYYACLLIITAGTSLVGMANDLVALFLALELISIPTYVMLYLPKNDAAAQEATTKYFLLSILSSALLLYGLSVLYGATGTTNLELMRNVLRNVEPEGMKYLLGIALVVILAGLGFRVTAVPFHFYAPDVYQGGPTLAVTLLAFIPKIAGFVALYQLATATLLVTAADVAAAPVLLYQASGLIWIVALVSMCIGNLLGLLQDNLKRLLAYSGIAHAGYVLVGLGAGALSDTSINGSAAVLFYVAVYSAMTVGAFGIIAYLSRSHRPVENVDDLAGVGRSHPLVALMMAIFLFSLTGLPPTAGFWAKLNIFLAAWSTGNRLYQILALVMAVNAAIGGWYYLRIIAAMYLRQPVKPLDAKPEVPALITLVGCTVLTLWFFLAPNGLWQAAQEAAPPLHATSAETLVATP